METLLLVLVILGITALLGVSMIIPNTVQPSFFYKEKGHKSRSFSRGFFIGMLIPILVFIILGGFGYALCSKGYCTLGNMIPLLSWLGVLWISLIAIRIITPIFIGKVATESPKVQTSLFEKKELKAQNTTKYISYTLLLSLLLLSLLIIDAESISNAIREFCRDFGWNRKFLESPYFHNSIARFFYMLNISALIGVVSTLRMVAGETERRGNESIQEQKIRDFQLKNKKKI